MLIVSHLAAREHFQGRPLLSEMCISPDVPEQEIATD
jgi:hypothetical protein